jgi:hemerythrin
MAAISKIQVAEGIFYVTVPEADVFILCGCPADSVKHLMRRGLIQPLEKDGVSFESGPNAILLSDVHIQNGRFTNLSEFPFLQIFYRQGRIVPGHPNNTGVKPALIGSRRQVEAQMEYIHRGNYGLVSEAEIMAAGVDAATAREMMRLKLKFAFGRIRDMEEYLDLVVVENDRQEIRNKVFIQRIRPNVFEISHGKNSVRVDLSCPSGAQDQVSYTLGYHHIKRDYFAVVHSGEGDGWDPNRPAMASILFFQGKIYLIDAGPNILHTLNALSISVNEIAGIFHTHAHDDHFCGLPSLMRADHRIPYYATPLVRASVMKKLAALAMSGEEEFRHYFDCRDLVLGQWNDIDTLEVMPVFSPHPVETTVMFFRTLDRTGYRTYAHFADIASLKLLRGMITADAEAPGISQARYDNVAANYLTPVDLKKLDIGGGMIHGDAEDFAGDASRKLVLAHTALPLTPRQKEIGSGAPFGTVDVLIPSHQDYERSYAFHFLASYFPKVAPSRLRVLLNNPVAKYNPESIILRSGRKADCVHLILTGQVDMLSARHGVTGTLSTGGLIGEQTALTDRPSSETYRAANFVQALRIPLDLYALFVRRTGLFDEMTRLLEIRSFLYGNRLFGDAMSCSRQNQIAAAVRVQNHPAGTVLERPDHPQLSVLKSGGIELRIGERLIDRVQPGGFYCESTVLFDIPCLFRATVSKDAQLFNIPAEVLADIPIIRWKLLEVYESRLERSVATDPTRGQFAWHEEYGSGVAQIDREHREIFRQAGALYRALFDKNAAEDPAELFRRLVDCVERHFASEETLMATRGYPALETHKRHHELIRKTLRDFASGFTIRRATSKKEAGIFIKDWVMTHILTEDRKLGTYLQRLGLR